MSIIAGNTLTCVKLDPFPGKAICPPLEKDVSYIAQAIVKCGCGEEHIDVGLESKYMSITCYKCGEDLPASDEIHWCHSSRFIVKE